MKQTVFLLIILYFSLDIYGQQDTVFITQNKGWAADTIRYETDTVIFPSGMTRHILTGTTVLPSTHNQMKARGFGLYLDKVTKSDCQQGGEEVYWNDDKINSILNTDSTLTVDINIYDNCCYDFLCDISVDSLGTLNLIYHGYGTYCACNCCFGLTFHFTKVKYDDTDDIRAVIISDNRKTLKKIE